MLSKEVFLKKYNKTIEEFEGTGLDWALLEKIYNDYVEEIPHLEASAVYIFNSLMKTDKVHSVRYRVKSPEHVIEKIIRKKIANPESDITLENYQQKLTDLIGVRALHLFKGEWLPIHHSITKTWNLAEKGVINYRDGDELLPSETLVSYGLESKKHNAAYRSIHYIVETKPAKKYYYAEIQVRTIFEEAWSEIDHTIRYPYDQHNSLFNQFLMIFNRLAGSADEMGTYISDLKEHVKETEASHASALLNKDKTIEDLENKIKNLKLSGTDYKYLTDGLQKLRVNELLNIPNPTSSPNLNFNNIARAGSIIDNYAKINTALKTGYFNTFAGSGRSLSDTLAAIISNSVNTKSETPKGPLEESRKPKKQIKKKASDDTP